MRRALVVFLFVFSLCRPAYALTVLKGEEADKFIGDIKQHLLAGKYTYDILGRSRRDAMNRRFSDGVIFNSGGSKFLFLRRRDSECIVVLNAPGGREEAPVNEDSWRQKVENALSDDNDYSYLFLDDSKNELAIVRVGRGTQVSGKMTPEGFLQIELKVAGASEAGDLHSRRL